MITSHKAQLNVGFYFLIVIVSITISVWSVYADPIINIDGILYLHAAQAFADGNTELALTFHKWPLYSLLISLVHQITGINLEFSAHLLNGILNIITCIAFLLLIKEFGASQTALFIGAWVIVLFPGLNELRSYLIRDHGYIAFYLISVYFLVRALDIRCKRLLISSMLAMVVATLFRIEGAVFLIAMPMIYLKSRTHVQPISRSLFFLLTVITIAILITVFGWWLYSPELSSLSSFNTFENVRTGWVQAGSFLDNKIEILKEHVLDTSSDTTGRLVYIWTSFGIIFAQVLIILSIPYAYLLFYALKNKLTFPNIHGFKVWRLLILFNLIILVIFTLTKFFLTDRYPLALTIVLLVSVPFALSSLYSRWQSKKRNSLKSSWGYLLFFILLLVNSFEGITSISSGTYLKEAGIWLEENLPVEGSLYSDNQLVGFYSSTPIKNLKIETNQHDLVSQFYRGEWINYDYLALVRIGDTKYQWHLDKTLWIEPEKIIKGEGYRQVRIYNIKAYREREQQ